MSDEALPGTVFNARQVRLLKIAVIAMGVLMVGGFGFVVSAIVYQASHLRQDNAAPAASEGGGQFVLPPGAKVTAMDLDGNRLALHLSGGSGEEIVVLDVRNGRVLSRVHSRAP